MSFTAIFIGKFKQNIVRFIDISEKLLYNSIIIIIKGW